MIAKIQWAMELSTCVRSPEAEDRSPWHLGQTLVWLQMHLLAAPQTSFIKSSWWPRDAQLTRLSSLVCFLFVSFEILYLSTLMILLLHPWATSNPVSKTLPLGEIYTSSSLYRLFPNASSPSWGHQSLLWRQQELLRESIIAGTNFS